MMLAIAPHLVRRDRIALLQNPPAGEAVNRVVLGRGVSWPWTSNDTRIADTGITGEAQAASAQFGEKLLAEAAETAGALLRQLLERRRDQDG
jgi:creatinine amidohydrolase